MTGSKDKDVSEQLPEAARPVLPKPKAPQRPGGFTTKAEHAAHKRMDKMVVKRMRKR